MADAPSFCPEGGWLVSEAPVPADPSDHWAHGVGDVLGCNRLRCAECGAAVRSAANLAPARKLSRPMLQELADEENWAGSPRLKKTWFSRLYACRCRAFEESSRRLLKDSDRDPTDVQLPWACSGHPAPQLPLDIDGQVLDAETDWDALVSAVFEGRVPAQAQTGHRELPASWLGRLYHRLGSLPASSEVARAIAAGLGSSRDEDVGAALLFFRWWPHAPGSERIEGLGLPPTRIYPCPFGKGSTPECVANTLAARLRRSTEAEAPVVAAVREGALSTAEDVVGGGRFEPLLRGLVLHDGEWVARNAADVAAGDPERAQMLLRSLRDLDEDALVTVAGIALIEANQPEGVRRFVDGAGARGRPFTPVLMAALSSG